MLWAMRSAGPGWARNGPPVGSRSSGHVLVVILALLLAACASPAAPENPAFTALSAYPPPPEGINMIAQRFVEPGADPVGLAVELRPDEADYAEVFRLDRVADARKHFDGYWQSPYVLGAAPGQTEFTTKSVTTEELLSGTGAAAEFASGYREVAPALAPGLRIYQVVFHRPGQTFGVVLDGFVHVNDRWRIVPQPWAVLTVNEPGHHH
jgi:hypothetical protein